MITHSTHIEMNIKFQPTTIGDGLLTSTLDVASGSPDAAADFSAQKKQVHVSECNTLVLRGNSSIVANPRVQQIKI